MTLSRKRRPDPVPHEPAHRRVWRSLWRRCSCGLPAPCVDRLVPAPRLPYPPNRAAPAMTRAADTVDRCGWFSTARETHGPGGRTRPIGLASSRDRPEAADPWPAVVPALRPAVPSDHTQPVDGSMEASSASALRSDANTCARLSDSATPVTAAWQAGVMDPGPLEHFGDPEDPSWLSALAGGATVQNCLEFSSVPPPANVDSQGAAVKGSVESDNPDRQPWPTNPRGASRSLASQGAESQTRHLGEAIDAKARWPARENDAPLLGDDIVGVAPRLKREAVTADKAWPQSATSDGPPRREPRRGQHLRAPAWAGPTVLLGQVGRAGDLTPGQAYRAGRGLSW
jgi:hypothetical protein